jgi:hypothetical protein
MIYVGKGWTTDLALSGLDFGFELARPARDGGIDMEWTGKTKGLLGFYTS